MVKNMVGDVMDRNYDFLTMTYCITYCILDIAKTADSR